MRAFLDRLFTKGTFASNVATLGAGSLAGQIATIAAAPILARLFEPAAFGELQYILSVGLILGAMATLRYEMALPLASSHRSAKHILVLASGLTLSVAILVNFILWLDPGILMRVKGNLISSDLIIFIPILVFLEAHNSIFSYWFTRTKDFKVPSLAKSAFGIGTAVSQLLMALGGLISGMGLILGYLGGQLASLLLYVFNYKKGSRKAGIERLSFNEVLLQAKIHKKFPLFSSWNVVLNTIARNLPPLLLVSYFSVAEAGFYAIGIRLLNMPLNTLGMSVGQVYYQQIARYREQGIPILPLMWSAVGKLTAIICVPLLLVYLFGEELFTFAFGETWARAGYIASLMVPFYFMRFIASPISAIFAVLGKQHLGLLWQAAYTAGTFASFYFTREQADFSHTIQTYSLVGAGLFFILLVMTIMNTVRSDREVKA